MIKILTLLLIGCAILGCNTDRKADYIHLSDKIVIQYLKDMERQHGLYCFGKGGGFLKQVNEVALFFDFSGPKNKEELREIIVLANESLLNRYNQNMEIRPFLKNYPFAPENISMSIVLVDGDGNTFFNKGFEKKLFYGVYQTRGVISYAIMNEEKPYIQDIYEEPYEEALKIVQTQRPGLFSK